MKTYTTLKNLYGSLTNNTSSTNLALGGQLISDQHRYYIQKYFDNERSSQFTTVGAMNLTTTGALASNATSATLTAAWTYPTCTQLVNFSNSNQRLALFTNGSASISWTGGLTSSATTAITTVGVQFYDIPANVSKIKNNTISIGQIKYQPTFIQTIQEWDTINLLPYTSDIPNYAFIYNGKLGIFPIPSTTGNIGNFNYKCRVPDLSFADYSTGNIALAGMVTGSTAVTGTGTSWTSQYPSGSDISFFNLYLRADPPNGDGMWYPIRQVNSDTSITLALPVVNAPNITGTTTYTIGQMPLLFEDFQDLPVYRAAMVYFNTTNKDVEKYKVFVSEVERREKMLEDYLGNKQQNLDLGDEPSQVNPNLFLYANS